MKFTMVITAVATLFAGAALAAPAAEPAAAADPQICYCGGGPGNCYDSCGQPFCC